MRPTAMPPMRRMTPSTTMAPPPHRDVLLLSPIEKHGQNSRPEKENRLHDTQRKTRLQHRTRLVNIHRKRVPRPLAVDPERAERDSDGASAPVGAVRGCDKTKLVDGGDEGSEEEQIDEGDEGGGAFGG